MWGLTCQTIYKFWTENHTFIEKVPLATVWKHRFSALQRSSPRKRQGIPLEKTDVQTSSYFTVALFCPLLRGGEVPHLPGFLLRVPLTQSPLPWHPVTVTSSKVTTSTVSEGYPTLSNGKRRVWMIVYKGDILSLRQNCVFFFILIYGNHGVLPRFPLKGRHRSSQWTLILYYLIIGSQSYNTKELTHKCGGFIASRCSCLFPPRGTEERSLATDFPPEAVDCPPCVLGSQQPACTPSSLFP